VGSHPRPRHREHLLDLRRRAFSDLYTIVQHYDMVDDDQGRVTRRSESTVEERRVMPSSFQNPTAFQKFVGEEYRRWGKLVREKNITAVA
jgi:hypothetical protein